jgi:glycosyltransferase involved in cell wall biosynthesis
MTSPLVSCIVPVFNGERYIGEALDSIFRQTYGPRQVILADDGSTDGTAAVVAGYGDRLAYLRQPNAGPAAARNLGLSVAQGELVAFLDADDLWHPEKLARQIARFRARPELDISIAHAQNFWIWELRAEEERFRQHRRGQPTPGYVTGAMLAKRSVFDAVGLFNTALRHSADTEWFLRAVEQGAVAELMPDALLYRRLHHTNLSRSGASESRAETLRLVKALLDRRRGRVGSGSEPGQRDALGGDAAPEAGGSGR